MEKLKQNLKNLMEAISTGDSVATYIHRIDKITQNLGKETPPMLRHYLTRRSYTKALDFLENK